MLVARVKFYFQKARFSLRVPIISHNKKNKMLYTELEIWSFSISLGYTKLITTILQSLLRQINKSFTNTLRTTPLLEKHSTLHSK